VTHDSGSGMPMSERMQSLLSRAVEDQQSEQHSLAGALDDVRTQLATLVHDIETTRSQPAAEPDATAVAALTVELRESTRRTGERLDAVSRMVGQRGEDIAALQNSLVAIGEQLRAQADGIAGLVASVDGIGQHLNGIATYLGERARDDGSRAVVTEQRLVTLQNDMTALGSHVAGLTEAAARNNGDDLDGRIRSMVAGALVGTERRLAAHIDEAVLALAEAMLRRRPAAPVEAAPAAAAPIEAAPVEAAPIEAAPIEAAPVAQPIAEAPPVAPPVAEAPQQPQPPQPPAEQPVAAAEVSAPAAPADLPAAQPLVDPFPAAPPAQPPVEEQPTATAPDQTVDVTDPALAANAGSNGGAPNAAVSNGAPKVPTAWTTVMPDDDQRRRGWFRSRD
jgi:hypothetical protein